MTAFRAVHRAPLEIGRVNAVYDQFVWPLGWARAAPSRTADGWVDLWYEADSAAPSRRAAFAVVGTGWRYPAAGRRPVGTAVDAAGLVWHVLLIDDEDGGIPDDEL
ncbi:MAG: hypothetical protein LBD51_03305 [Bifidobacteriaceae bacterium]|jgi:hypothetical protein|nr:hypothetical protein [Bifidobacteriaceae bacterium]